MKKEVKRIIKETIGFSLIVEIVALFAGFLGYVLDEGFMRLFTIVNFAYGLALVITAILELICWAFKDDPEG